MKYENSLTSSLQSSTVLEHIFVYDILKAGFQHADFSASADFYACADFSAYPQDLCFAKI